MRTGLVLEGGAMRGLYTSGVLDALMDEGMGFDVIVGVSAGALFGVNLPSAQRGRGIRYNLKYMGDRRYISLWSLLTTGNIVNAGFTYYKLCYELDPFHEEAFKRSGVEFYAVVTNMSTGQPEYIKLEAPLEQMEVLRATSAMPFVSKPVYLEGVPYLDGGIGDSVPVDFCLGLGCQRVAVVLTQPEGYRKEAPSPLRRAMARVRYGRYPSFVESLNNRWLMYNGQAERVSALEAQGRIFVIRPSRPLDIERLEKDKGKLRETYELGLRDCAAALPGLKEYLK